MGIESKLREDFEAGCNRRRKIRQGLMDTPDGRLLNMYVREWSKLGWMVYGKDAQAVVDRRLERCDAVQAEILLRMRGGT